MDTLASYGLRINPTCRLCSFHLESFHHLFFQCAYSTEVCRTALAFFGWNLSYASWDDFSTWVSNSRLPRVSKDILKLSFTAIVYSIWHERNCRVFDRKQRSPGVLASYILTLVRSRLHNYSPFHRVLAHQPNLSYWCF